MPTEKSRKPAKKMPVKSKGNGAHPSKRVNKLFSDIENIALQSVADYEGVAREKPSADVMTLTPAKTVAYWHRPGTFTKHR